jgi:hypothetical protein
MFKSIPKSNISNRSFNVYKLWNTSESEYPIIKVENKTGLFVDEANLVHALYNSLKSKYYSHDGNTFTTFGTSENLAELAYERQLPNTFQIIPIDRNRFGEEIKKESVVLTAGGLDFFDDGYGIIREVGNSYTLVSLDLDNNGVGYLTINDGIGVYNIEVKSASAGGIMDLNDGSCQLIYNSDEDEYFIIAIDFQNNKINFTAKLTFDNTDIKTQVHGNVFYDDGLIVMTDDILFDSYSLDYRSTQTIYETEILISANTGEFNYSQNPTAVNVLISGSYDFEITGVNNSFPAGTRKIKEVLDISRREFFSGSIGSVSGSWEDYYTNVSNDPTGSYLTTYITTIGLYDDDDNLLVVAKLPKPIKNLPDYNLNFLVRFDT